MKSILTGFAGICFILLLSCESGGYRPPPVTAKMTKIGQRPSFDSADLATLQEGRRLFVARCIECHTLPIVTRYSASEWPGLVDEMAGRANLKPSQHNAVLAYILAARAQP
jgi:hypothetical protein